MIYGSPAIIICTNRKKEKDQSLCVASASCACDCVSPPVVFTVPWISASCSLALALSLAMLQERSSSELGPSGPSGPWGLSHLPDLRVPADFPHALSADHGWLSSPPRRLSPSSPSQLKLLLAFSGVSSLSLFAYGLVSWPWSFSCRLILARRF